MQLLKGKLCTYNNKTTFECEDEIFLSRKRKKKIEQWKKNVDSCLPSRQLKLDQLPFMYRVH